MSFVMMHVCAVLMSSGSFSLCGPTPVKFMHSVSAEIVDTVVCSLGFWTSPQLRKMQMLRCVQKDVHRILLGNLHILHFCCSIHCRTVMSTVHLLGFPPTSPLA